MNITLDSSNPAGGTTCKVGQPCKTGQSHQAGRPGSAHGGSERGGTSPVLNLRQRAAVGLTVMPDSDFRLLCDDTGISAAAHFDDKRD